MNTKSGMFQVAFKLAGPVFAEECYSMLLSAAITAIVGNLGSDSLAAFSLATLLCSSSIVVIGVIGTGSAVLVAREVGAGNRQLLRQITGQTIAMGVGAGIVLAIAGYLAADHLPFLGDTPLEIAQLTRPLLKSLFPFAPFFLITWLGKSILRGMGETRLAFIVMAINNTAAFLATSLLVYLLNPDQGPLNAVWGMGTGAVAGSVSVLALLFSNRKVRLPLSDIYLLRPNIVRRIVGISIPVAWEQVGLHVGFTLFTLELVQVGAEQFAGNQIAQQLESIPAIIGAGFSAAVLTFVGQTLARNRSRLAERFTRFVALITMVGMGMAGLLLYLGSGPLIAFFTDDPETAYWAGICLLLSVLEQPSVAIELAIGNALRGAGDTRWPAFSSIVGMWLIRLPLTYLLIDKLDYSIGVAWLITTADHFIRASLLALRFWYGPWKSYRY